MQEIAILLKENLVEESNASDINDNAEDSLTKHLCFGSSYVTANREFALWYGPHEDVCCSVLHGLLNNETCKDSWDKYG